MADGLAIKDDLEIPASELRVSFARSGGPGGQNVNKVETKVELRWNLHESAVLDERQRERLVDKLSSRLTKEGELLVTSSKTREQHKNLSDARAKLAELVRAALAPTKPRVKTKRSKASQRRRIEEKRQRGEIKDRRRRPKDDD